MMPSRGLHIARGNLPRLFQAQCRNLSSTPRANLRIVSSAPRTCALRKTKAPIPSAIPSIAAIRYASTAPSPPTPTPPTQAPPATPTPPPSETASLSNIDSITLDGVDAATTVAADPSAIPGTIGYLHQVGLNYGLGPTSAIQWILEHVHVWGGLPWWAAIPVTGFITRLALFPLFIKASDSMARQAALTPITQPIMERMTNARKTGETAETLQTFQELNDIRKRAGVSYRAQFVPLALQGVIGFCGFKLMRAMASLPVPDLKEGGFLWLTDLTVCDGYLVLPLIMAGTIHVVARMGGEAGVSATISPRMRSVMMWAMPALAFLFTAWQPGAVALWFLGTGIIGLTQGRLLQNRDVRKRLGITPMYTPPSISAPPPPSTTFATLSPKFATLMGKQEEKVPKETYDAISAEETPIATGVHYQAPKIRRSPQRRVLDPGDEPRLGEILRRSRAIKARKEKKRSEAKRSEVK